MRILVVAGELVTCIYIYIDTVYIYIDTVYIYI